MRASSILLFLVSLTSLAIAKPHPSRTNVPNCPPHPASPQEQALIFQDYAHKFFVQQDPKTALLEHVIAGDDAYIQHNPYLTNGRDKAIAYLVTVIPYIGIDIISQGFDNNIGWVHSKNFLSNDSAQATADFFRFDGSCIVEHWDVMEQKLSSYPNPLALW